MCFFVFPSFPLLFCSFYETLSLSLPLARYKLFGWYRECSTCVEEELLNPLSRCQELLSEFGKNTRVVPDLSVLAIGSSPTEGIDPLRLASDVSLLSAVEDHLHPHKKSETSSTFPSDDFHSSFESSDSLVDTAEPDAGGDQDLLVRLRSSDQELIQKLGSSLLVEGRFQMTLQFEEIEKSYGNLIEWITSSMNPLAEKRVRTRLVFSKVKTGSSAISKALMSIKEFFSKISVLNGATDILSGVVDQFCNVFACSSLSSSQVCFACSFRSLISFGVTSSAV